MSVFKNSNSVLNQRVEQLPSGISTSAIDELKQLLQDATLHLGYLKELYLVVHHCISISEDSSDLAWTILDACDPPAEATLDEIRVAVQRSLSMVHQFQLERSQKRVGFSRNFHFRSRNAVRKPSGSPRTCVQRLENGLNGKTSTSC